MWEKIINFYNTNLYFHSFILAIEAAIISFFTSYNGGIPASRAAWISLAFAVGGALWGAIKRWMATNVATAAVPMKKAVEPVIVVECANTKGETK